MKNRLAAPLEKGRKHGGWPADLPQLPHHRLLAWEAVRELLRAVVAADIDDVDLRNQALRAAKSACCNTAEGAGKVSRRDKARSFAVARAEAVEAAGATETAADCGSTSIARAVAVVRAADRAVALLTGLIRR